METLSIKELAPYLPYSLKIMDSFGVATMSMYENGGRNISIGVCLIKGCKPLLRPLSDLTTLGVDSIPINEHTINLLIQEKYNLDYGLFSVWKNEIDLELESDSSLMYDRSKSISFNVFLTIQEELLKGHYDIFNLIERGLAIDLNTIKETVK